MLSKLRSAQRGDTIIEVLIVLAILGTAFSLAYATASRSLNASRQAQEHSEALQFISTQVELLRTTSAPEIFTSTKSFCLQASGTGIVEIGTAKVPDAAGSDNLSAYPVQCSLGQDIEGDGKGLYKTAITYYPSPMPATAPQLAVFVLTVRWNGPGATGVQQESITYKRYEQ